MKSAKTIKEIFLVAVILLLLMFCGVNSVAAKSTAEIDKWQYEFTLYGWFPSLDSTLKYPDPGGDVSVDASDILDSLNFIFMGTLEAQKNKLSFGLDVIYLDLSNSKNTNIQIGPGTGLNVNAGLGIKSWVVTGIVGYEVAQSEKNRTAVIGGFRFLDLSADVDIAVNGPPPPTPPPAYLSGSEDFWDIIIGFKGTYMLNEKWYIPYYADIGTCTVSGQQVDCLAATMTAQSDASLSVGVTGSIAGVHRYNVTVSSATDDRDELNNTASGSIAVSDPSSQSNSGGDDGGGGGGTGFPALLILLVGVGVRILRNSA